MQKNIHIRINSGEENKDKGFFELLTSGNTIKCLENEEYLVPSNVLKVLNKKKVDFEVI